MSKPPRIIAVIVREGNHFDVHEGERYCDRLCWEEMLVQIATMTHPQINAARFPMLLPDEHAARRARWASPPAGPDVVDAEVRSEERPNAADRLAAAVSDIQKVSAYLAIPADLRAPLERAMEDVTDPVLPF